MFSEIRNPTVRFGALFRHSKSYGAVRCCDKSYGAVRCGSPLNVFCYGAGRISAGKTAQNRFFPTAVHRMNKPCKTAVSYGSQDFSRGTNETAVFLRCTVWMNRKKTAVSYGSQAFSRGTNETAVSPRCTVWMNRLKKRGLVRFLTLFFGAQTHQLAKPLPAAYEQTVQTSVFVRFSCQAHLFDSLRKVKRATAVTHIKRQIQSTTYKWT